MVHYFKKYKWVLQILAKYSSSVTPNLKSLNFFIRPKCPSWFWCWFWCYHFWCCHQMEIFSIFHFIDSRQCFIWMSLDCHPANKLPFWHFICHRTYPIGNGQKSVLPYFLFFNKSTFWELQLLPTSPTQLV